MSLHRYVVPPPLALKVHPAPPVQYSKKTDKKDDKSTKKDAKDDKEKQDGKDKPPKDDNTKNKGKADAPEVKRDAGPPVKKKNSPNGHVDTHPPAATPVTPTTDTSMMAEPPTPASGNENGVDPTPVPERKAAAKDDKKGDSLADKDNKDKTEKEDEPSEKTKEGEKESNSKPTPPPEPLRLLSPAPHRPLRTKLDLNPAKPYPPINTDPRGAYFKYARGVGAEWILIDIPKDGWLAEQWREKGEREALARLRGDAERQRDREVEALSKRNAKRKVPKTSEEILLDLWNDLAEALNYEIPADEFWARYDFEDPDAQIHLTDTKRYVPKSEKARDEQRKEKDSKKEDKIDENKDTEDSRAEAAPNTSSKDDKSGASPASRDREEKDKDEPKETPEEISAKQPAVHWTCSGVEEILATVGIQFAYNSEKPLGRSWTEPAGAYLLMAHGFFMLRLEDQLSFKSEEAANSFEILKTSGHDRVFGEMVKAQQAAERKKKDAAYKERKLAEKKKAEQDAKKAKAEGREVDEKGSKDDKVKEKAKRRESKEDKKEKDEKKTREERGNNPDQAPDSPTSVARVKNGEEIGDKKRSEGDVVVGKIAEGGIAGNKDEIYVAVPVKDDEKVGKKSDAHEEEARAVADSDERKAKEEGAGGVEVGKEKKQERVESKKDKGYEVTHKETVKEKGGENGNQEGEKDEKGDKTKDKAKDKPPAFVPRDAELLAKMIQATGGAPEGIPMEEIKMAFKALEQASGGERRSSMHGHHGPVGPIVWVWGEPCEKWRWRNYQAGLQDIGSGGWEERDWKIFADGREVLDFVSDQEWLETQETDVHDWSC